MNVENFNLVKTSNFKSIYSDKMLFCNYFARLKYLKNYKFVALNFHYVKILGNLVFEHFDFVFSLFFCHFFSAKIHFRKKKKRKNTSKCTKKLGLAIKHFEIKKMGSFYFFLFYKILKIF